MLTHRICFQSPGGRWAWQVSTRPSISWSVLFSVNFTNRCVWETKRAEENIYIYMGFFAVWGRECLPSFIQAGATYWVDGGVQTLRAAHPHQQMLNKCPRSHVTALLILAPPLLLILAPPRLLLQWLSRQLHLLREKGEKEEAQWVRWQHGASHKTATFESGTLLNLTE